MQPAVGGTVPVPEGMPAGTEPTTYKVGTLQYTKMGLFWVCVWLLWGDFIWTLLDQSLPNVLPLKLKDMGAGDTANQLLCRSLAYAIGFMLAPIVSMHSDRHRSRWGRRIPYLLWSTPFVGLFLILIGCSDTLTDLTMGTSDVVSFLGFAVGRKTMALAILGAMLLGFDFANVFVNTIYWYLFNDVVPEQFITRFYALFRMVGLGAGMVFSKWIFPHSLEHFQFVFVVAGVCYVAGFMVMCFTVKEGEYPPPPENVDKRKGFIASAKTFAKECFTHKFYWYFFLTSSFLFIAGQSGTFAVLRNRDSLKISMQELGDLGFWNNAIALLVVFPCGWLADKWHPLRVYLLATFLCFLQPLAQCVWIFFDFGHDGNLYWQYVIAMALLPITQIQQTTEIPMYMRVLPKDRYGQFCSANATLRSFALMFGAAAAGLMMDFLKTYAGMDEWRYRYYAAWTVFWQIPGLICLVLLYKEWKARGGEKGYTPPAA